MNQTDFVRFLKVRLAILGATAVVTATSLLGVIDLFTTASVDALPVYVHVTVAVAVFPVVVFALEYRGFETVDAVGFGAGVGVAAVLLFLLLSEGMGRIFGGVFELGVPTVFYVATVSVVASTVFVAWVDRVYLGVPAAHRQNPRRRDRRE
ncbi:MAG: hypothetical protein ACLFSW_02790 [Halobacteriales archaeon]